MASASRESIYQALFAIVSSQSVYGWQTTARRLKLWGDVPLDEQPALYQFEGEPDKYVYSSGTVYGSQKRTICAKLFCYTNAKDPTIIGSTALNNMLDAFDAALNPSGADLATGLNTLGGLVYSCRIAGVPLKDVGDIDGQSLLIVDVEMVLP